MSVVIYRKFDPEKVAAKIVRELFELGDEPNSPVQRIQFMGGKYTGHPETERGQGGFSEVPLAAWLAKRLRENM